LSTQEKRRRALAASLAAERVEMALFEDTEGRRDPAIRYFTGHPGDALLFIAADGRSLLVPWDINMAAAMASVDGMLAYSEYARSPYFAMAGALDRLGIPKGSVVDLPSVTPYPMFVDYVEACPDHDFRCTEDGSTKAAALLRSVKDADEIAAYRKVSSITDAAMDEIEARVRSGTFVTEIDAALFIERFLRDQGCESTGFETLAAGPSRSFGIHAFPACTAAPFATEGMSILDFGLSWKGYTSDVTMSFVRGPLSDTRVKMVELVQEAHDKAVSMCRPGVRTRDVAAAVDELFAANSFTMPHALGHGLGLQAHEAPAVRNRDDNHWILAPGHIITIEPGLYDPEAGGVRLEDDVLITETGAEILTHSRIVRL
jgi:Xaa-Pro dipeptidase